MYYLYVVFITLLMPVEMFRLLVKSFADPRLRNRLRQTFTIQDYKFTFSKPVIWIHAVSVGEVQASKPLVSYLLNTYTDHQILMTTVTVTGAELVSSTYDNSVRHQYLPYDQPFLINRRLANFNPVILLVIETEIWPALYKSCQKRNIPIFIINARMSDDSYKRYLKLSRLTRYTLDHVDKIIAQSRTDAERFSQFVSDPKKISVNKNLKFDAVEKGIIDDLYQRLKVFFNGRSVIIAASTHAGEETIMTNTFVNISKEVKDVFYLIAPRHPERAGEVISIAKESGFKPGRYSESTTWQSDCDMLIIDTIGALQQLYLLADIVVMGGSFVSIGGHNMLEPAMASRAIITGPYVENFREIYQLLYEAGGISQVQDDSELKVVLLEFLHDANLRKAMGAKANKVVLDNQGGVNYLIKHIDGYIKPEI